MRNEIEIVAKRRPSAVADIGKEAAANCDGRLV
jgi:hypothetical protein